MWKYTLHCKKKKRLKYEWKTYKRERELSSRWRIGFEYFLSFILLTSVVLLEGIYVPVVNQLQLPFGKYLPYLFVFVGTDGSIYVWSD